jgi:hypothetical protein
MGVGKKSWGFRFRRAGGFLRSGAEMLRRFVRFVRLFFLNLERVAEHAFYLTV